MFAIAVKTPWYADVENYLVVGKLPKHLTARERKHIFQHSTRFSWIGIYLFHTWSNMCIRRCIREDEKYNILEAFHDEACRGYFEDCRTGHKVLQMGYYWHTIFKDGKKYVQYYDILQRMCHPGQSHEMSLQPQLVIEAFE